LLESTNSQGVGFSWLDLWSDHILVDLQGKVRIDVCQHCLDWLFWRRLAAYGDENDKERRIAQMQKE
jgi:hypothetical protein